MSNALMDRTSKSSSRSSRMAVVSDAEKSLLGRHPAMSECHQPKIRLGIRDVIELRRLAGRRPSRWPGRVRGRGRANVTGLQNVRQLSVSSPRKALMPLARTATSRTETAGQVDSAGPTRPHALLARKQVEQLTKTRKPQVRRPSSPAPESPRTPHDASSRNMWTRKHVEIRAAQQRATHKSGIRVTSLRA